MKMNKKGDDKNQAKPVGNKPMAEIKATKAYTKSYSKGKQNLKK